MPYESQVHPAASQWRNLAAVLNHTKILYTKLEDIETYLANVLEDDYDLEDDVLASDEKTLLRLQEYARGALDDLQRIGIVTTLPGDVPVPQTKFKDASEEYDDATSIALAEAFDHVHALLNSVGFLEAVYQDAYREIEGPNRLSRPESEIQAREIEQHLRYIDAVATLTLDKVEKLRALVAA